MKAPILLSLVTILSASLAHADFSYKAGVVEITANGGDGDNSGDGGSAGDITLNLSYADAAKTQVKIDGQIKQGKAKTVSQVIPVAGLKQIIIQAIGGDGYAGRDGSDGSSGWSGNDGWSGCPPSDGSDGRDGGDGSDGGNGGDGGRGGNILVSVPADQNEILLLVKTNSQPGRGGAGGRGGSGGSGGSGGRGGRNTCTDAKGNPTNGPDGRDGRNGSSGSNGRSGYSGRDGRQGSETFQLVDGSNVQSFNRTFGLTINGIKALDDNEDGVVQPGEGLSITEITVANKGPMPSPKGQLLQLALQNSSTLTLVKVPAIAIEDQIAGGTTKTLTFAKGEVVLKAPDNAKLIGEKAILASQIRINAIALQNTDETGLEIRWPVSITAAHSSAEQYFKQAKSVAFAIKNVGRQPVGQGGQPVDVTIEWVSKTVPGADVSVTLPDGRKLQLDKAAEINDLTIAAKSTLAFPLSVEVANSKNVLIGAGNLKVTLKLKDFSSDGQDAVDASTTAVNLAVDLRGTRISRHIELDQPEVRCGYPESFSKEAKTIGLEISKDKNSEKVSVRITTDGFLSKPQSQWYVVSAFDFAAYGNLVKSSSPSLVAGFLSNVVAAATRRGADRTWAISTCKVVKQ